MNTQQVVKNDFRMVATFLLIACVLPIGSFARAQDATVASQTLDDQEREIDKKQMLQIYEAIQTYRQKHGDLPKWLSDLVPDYLPDPKVLISPVERRTGQSQLFTYGDPKIKSSYIYQFNESQAGGAINQGREKPLTMKQWKSLQMEEFGPATPILRCHSHSPVLNVSFSGEFYETELFWESDPVTYALVKRLGPGPGARGQKTIPLKVLDAETGAPVAGVDVTVSNRRSELGALPPRTVTTDSQGECRVPLGGQTPQSAALSFSKSGYANAPVGWDGGEGAIPSEYTATLSRATSIGGIVRDQAGQPVPDVTVTVSGVARDDAGQFLLVEYDSVQTDRSGHWKSERVPKDFKTLSFRLSHSEYLPAEYDQASSDQAEENEVSKADLLAAKAIMQLLPGIDVAGAVMDEQKQPLAGAEVVLRDTSATPKKRAQRTDEKGRFRFVVLEPGDFHLVAQAPGFGPSFRALDVQPELEPVEFTLAPGKTLKGRVLDGEGKPVAGAGVAVTSWHNLPLLTWHGATDSEGRFSWDGAPEGPIVLTASRDGLVPATRQVSAESGDEITFRLVKTFMISGKIVDAATKEPIQQFSIVQGYAWDMMEEARVNWEFHDEKQGSDGAYTATRNRDQGGGPNMQIKLMARADGYLPAVSPSFPASGWHSYDFELKTGSGPNGVVKLPTGEPVTGAEVAILGAGYLNLGKAALKNVGQRGSFTTKTDVNGRFSLPAVLASPTVVAVHEQGYAEISADALAKEGGVLTIEPWGRVEGVLKRGTQPWPNESVMIAPKQAGGGVALNYDGENFKTTTDEQGRFNFSHVPPGERQLVRLIPMDSNSWMWSHVQPVEVRPGELTKILYGGVGRPIVGKLVLSDPNRKVDWNSGHRNFSTKYPSPPSNLRTPEERREWNNSPEAKKARASHRYYGFQIADDGSFRLDNIPPGTYQLSIHLNEPGEQRYRMGPPIGSLMKEVVVDEIPGGVTDEPIDLGELTIQARQPVQAAQRE